MRGTKPRGRFFVDGGIAQYDRKAIASLRKRCFAHESHSLRFLGRGLSSTFLEFRIWLSTFVDLVNGFHKVEYACFPGREGGIVAREYFYLALGNRLHVRFRISLAMRAHLRFFLLAARHEPAANFALASSAKAGERGRPMATRMSARPTASRRTRIEGSEGQIPRMRFILSTSPMRPGNRSTAITITLHLARLDSTGASRSRTSKPGLHISDSGLLLMPVDGLTLLEAPGFPLPGLRFLHWLQTAIVSSSVKGTTHYQEAFSARGNA